MRAPYRLQKGVSNPCPLEGSRGLLKTTGLLADGVIQTRSPRLAPRPIGQVRPEQEPAFLAEFASSPWVSVKDPASTLPIPTLAVELDTY